MTKKDLGILNKIIEISNKEGRDYIVGYFNRGSHNLIGNGFMAVQLYEPIPESILLLDNEESKKYLTVCDKWFKEVNNNTIEYPIDIKELKAFKEERYIIDYKTTENIDRRICFNSKYLIWLMDLLKANSIILPNVPNYPCRIESVRGTALLFPIKLATIVYDSSNDNE